MTVSSLKFAFVRTESDFVLVKENIVIVVHHSNPFGNSVVHSNQGNVESTTSLLLFMKSYLFFAFFLVLVTSSRGFGGVWEWTFKKLNSPKRLTHHQDGSKRLPGPPLHEGKVSVPEELFKTSVVSRKNPHCYRARLELEKLCRMRSPDERMRMASLVTNCHLEVSGRPTFLWDPVHKLKYAEYSHVHLVMIFLPLMRNVCENVGRSAIFAQMVSDTTGDDVLREKLVELQEATKRLEKANLQSSEFVREYIRISADASVQAAQIQNVFSKLKATNDMIEEQREVILKETSLLHSDMKAFSTNSRAQLDSLFGQFEGFQGQLAGVGGVVDQLRSDSRMTSSLLNLPFRQIFREPASHGKNSNGTNTPRIFDMGSFRHIRLLKEVILAPIKLSERMSLFEGTNMFGPVARDVFSSVHLFLMLFSFYLLYQGLVMLTKGAEAILRFIAIFQPAAPLLLKAIRIFDIRSRPKHNEDGAVEVEELPKRLCERAMEASLNPEIVDQLAEKLAINLNEAELSLILSKLVDMDTRLTRISEELHSVHVTTRRPGNWKYASNSAHLVSKNLHRSVPSRESGIGQLSPGNPSTDAPANAAIAPENVPVAGEIQVDAPPVAEQNNTERQQKTGASSTGTQVSRKGGRSTPNARSSGATRNVRQRRLTRQSARKSRAENEG